MLNAFQSVGWAYIIVVNFNGRLKTISLHMVYFNMKKISIKEVL